MTQPLWMAKIPVGMLMRKAIRGQNEDAQQLLLPLFELVQHPGFTFAREKGMTVAEVVACAKPHLTSFGFVDTIVHQHGLLTAQTLVKLDILELDTSPSYLSSLMTRHWIDELRLLISLGIDVSGQVTNGETTMHFVERADMAELLCQAGVPVTGVDWSGRTPISNAVYYRRKDVLAVLLRQKVAKGTLDIRNKHGKAAVHYAELEPEILAILINAGADPTLEIGPKDEDWRGDGRS